MVAFLLITLRTEDPFLGWVDIREREKGRKKKGQPGKPPHHQLLYMPSWRMDRDLRNAGKKYSGLSIHHVGLRLRFGQLVFNGMWCTLYMLEVFEGVTSINEAADADLTTPPQESAVLSNIIFGVHVRSRPNKVHLCNCECITRSLRGRRNGYEVCVCGCGWVWISVIRLALWPSCQQQFEN